MSIVVLVDRLDMQLFRVQSTLSNSLSRWLSASYLYKLVGIGANWQQASWFLQYPEYFGAALIAVVIGLAPFVSTTLIGFLLVAIALFWFLLILIQANKPTITPIHALIFLYWSIATVSVAFSPVRGAATSGWVKLTLYFILFALAARVLESSRLRSWLMTLVLLVSLPVSIYGIRQEMFGARQLATWNDPTSTLAQDTRVYSYLGNPNLLGGYLLVAIALSLSAVLIWRGWLPKALAVLIFGVNSACLFFTDSRGAWLSMFALLVTYAVLLRYWWSSYLPLWARRWLLPMTIGSLAVAILLALVLVEPFRLRLLSIFAGRSDSSNNFRINVWIAVFKMIRDRPLIGIGPGNEAFNLVYPLYAQPRYPALSAYSIYIETAVETGILGLICFIGLIITTLVGGVRRLLHLRQFNSWSGVWLMGAVAAIVGMAVQGMVDTVWYRPQINLLWWLMVAVVASEWSLGQQNIASKLEKTPTTTNL